ncbi:hypothetical protein NQZ79_g2605 [Umbelopsis isabellina]|nr:hypothetical protein NQZ79_g2605 [Umbelopsis isabellina]
MTTTTSLLSPPLTPTSDNQSIAEDVPWAVNHKSNNKPNIPIDHYTTASSPPELNARKSRNKSLIRYQQAMVMPQTPRPKKEFIHFNQLISVKASPSSSAHSRKSSRPRRSLQRDERSDQKVFQLRVYDTDPSKLLQCSSRTIQPPMIKSDSADESSNSEEEQVIAQMKRRRALSDANESMSKKCKTDAAMAFDRVHVEESDHEFFDPEWIPSYQVFDQRPPVRVVWKGSPLQISNMPYYDKLHLGEVNIASTLRLTPEQYIKCKRTLIQAASRYESQGVPFRKSDAQKLCRVDVNKTSTLWSIFGKLGWMGNGCIN